MTRRHWLMKSEPTAFSLADLRRMGTEHWDGVRNYQARNHMREMRLGDKVLFYHSNCAEPGVVGLAEVARAAYPDQTSWDPGAIHFDPRSTPEAPRWSMVDVKYVEAFPRTVLLAEMRGEKALAGMDLLKRGQRLSVMPVSKEEYEVIVRMGRAG